MNEGTEKPDILYKYFRFADYTDKIFTDNKINFASPNEFNDPYDTRIRYVFEGTRQQKKKFFENKYPKAKPWISRKQNKALSKKFSREINDITYVIKYMERRFNEIHRNKLGVLCLTDDPVNLLMWAHYTDNHKGFCLGFDATNPFFESAMPVNYDKDVPTINLLEDPHQNKDHNVKALLTKSDVWKYEHERRLINHQQGPGLYRYPSGTLKKVILGCKIENKDKSRIITLCKTINPFPEILQAKMSEAEYSIELIGI